MIVRRQIEFAKSRLFKGKALIIYGPRQAGKTTFCEQLLSGMGKKVLKMNGDDADTRELLSSPNEEMLRRLTAGYDILLLDEAQRITEVGLAIKIFTDRIKEVQVIATGSSSFELAGTINEPLTGRKYELRLLPLAHQEMVEHTDFLTERRLLEHRLIYGLYPEVVTKPKDAEEHLKLLADSYLYKDIFQLEMVKRPQLFSKLVRALALQIGSEVNFTEIGRTVGADNKTVEKYIGLLEQAFVVFTRPAFSRNVRNEIRKGRKIYFYDNGIVNAITGNFKPLALRQDQGALWENYLMSERLKWLNLNRIGVESYFWRTTQQQEVDYIELSHDQLKAYEFKFGTKKAVHFPLTFRSAYPDAELAIINPENYHTFIGE
jgi:predicted AAA+ superfamily ATPase